MKHLRHYIASSGRVLAVIDLPHNTFRPHCNASAATYERFTRNKGRYKPRMCFFVRRGSYRIGTVAMASDRDPRVILTRELLTLRVDPKNKLKITPYYLLALLSSQPVQDQIQYLTFIDTTLPNIGDRWRELQLPIHRRTDAMQAMSRDVCKLIRQKWAAQDAVDQLRRTFGGLVT